MSWEVRLDPPASGAVNMARDLELLESAGRPVLRLYGWSEPTLSLGYAQKDDWVRWDGPLVRRLSGGRALLHDQEITYCIVLPWRGRVDEAFCKLAGCLRAALVALGVPARCAGSLEKSQSEGCMATVRPGEIVTPLGKLVGCAQVRRGERLLHHGVIPLRVDNELLQRAIPGHPALHGLDELWISLGMEQLAGVLLEELQR